VKPSLQGYTAAVLGSVSGDAALSLASELEAVHDLVDRTPQLHAALTDTSMSGATRRAVVSELLQGRVSDAARRTASFAAGATSAPELPSALAWLATHARRSAEGIGDAEPSLGYLSSRERVAGYATAMFETVPTESLDAIEDELFRFTRTVEAMPALRTALSNRDLPLAIRLAVVGQLLSGKVEPATLSLVGYAIEGGRSRDLVGTLDYLVEHTARARGWRVARVYSAREIEAREREELSLALTQLAGTPVELQVTIDEKLLSGVRVQVGDLLVDSTTRGRLDALHEHLFSRGWEDLLDEPEQGTEDKGAR
jgi:F-type H+-transporting ATPase subunit delta